MYEPYEVEDPYKVEKVEDPYEVDDPYEVPGQEELPPEQPDPSDYIDAEFEEPEGFVPTVTFFNGYEAKTVELKPLLRAMLLSGDNDFIPKDENGNEYPTAFHLPDSVQTDDDFNAYMKKLIKEVADSIREEQNGQQ